MSYVVASEKSVFRGYDSQGKTVLSEYVSRSVFRSGPNTANFWSLRKKKQSLPTNAYTATVTTRAPGSVTRTQRSMFNDGTKTYPQTLTSVSMFLAPSPSEIADSRSRAYRSCVSAFNSRLKSTTFNAAQAFGERKQVVNMIASTAVKLATSFSLLRKGRLTECIRSLGLSVRYVEARSNKAINRYKTSHSLRPFDAAADLWLEIQYGWKPLVQDIHNAAETLAKIQVQRQNDSFHTHQTVSGKGEITTRSVVNTGTGGDTDVTVVELTSLVRMKATYRVTNDFLRYSNMFGMTNPALLAWELTPFSFVVDWFLPIGNYLENVMASCGVSLIKGSVSYKFIGQTSGSGATLVYYGPNSWIKTDTNKGRTKVVTYDRSPMLAFPREPLPAFKNPLSIGHALNAIALLQQSFRR